MKDEKINYMAALRLIQPNMELSEPIEKEWIVGHSSTQVEMTKSMSSTANQFSKTGFPSNKQLKTLNNEYYGISNNDRTLDRTFDSRPQKMSSLGVVDVSDGPIQS
jgi:hypothetical protein